MNKAYHTRYDECYVCCNDVPRQVCIVLRDGDSEQVQWAGIAIARAPKIQPLKFNHVVASSTRQNPTSSTLYDITSIYAPPGTTVPSAPIRASHVSHARESRILLKIPFRPSFAPPFVRLDVGGVIFFETSPLVIVNESDPRRRRRTLHRSKDVTTLRIW